MHLFYIKDLSKYIIILSSCSIDVVFSFLNKYKIINSLICINIKSLLAGREKWILCVFFGWQMQPRFVNDGQWKEKYCLMYSPSDALFIFKK